MHKNEIFLGFLLKRDNFIEPQKDKKDCKGDKDYRKYQGEHFCNNVVKYAMTTTPLCHGV